MITKGSMTDKKVNECKRHIRIINSFDKMCKKIESTKVRPLTIFKKTATNELKDFLEICKKELLNCKK